ncbi:high nitrogen upregulated cytochrome P450 monooxygenase 2 [Lentinus tigrinus ALCF2SS1-7]|uniref:High nitrogen upregulated cytochrome P450 monooxygenase 2 n=1 Tax=Lentinus tigrinus ALCF2SS1-6 TaxID=1328759 RepID=A0A5C2SBE9_9APHY|nr:high nitrogen upregulated cytochrome P450 monooxygenase 2 [Lentinus tigrinus ALCF2SS1-6]RPD75851.1 high nitrogen upregulated cytochrome P450 monooxygenase 2 [Lentinus tigrinus ALCF2SS1-7]
MSSLQVNIVLASAILALVAHQLFRHNESYSPLLHGILVFGPPCLVAIYAFSFGDSPFDTFRQALITHIATLLSSIVVYRLSPWHPLARYPGPWSHAVTALVAGFWMATGNRNVHVRSLHERYGDVVRTAPNELSISDLSAIPHLWNVPRGPGMKGVSMSHTQVTMMGIQDPEEHARRRRPWNRGLNQAALKEYEGHIMNRAQLLVRRLEEQHGGTDLSKWLAYFAQDVMGDMAFGGVTELIRDGGHNNVFSVLEEGMIAAATLSQLPWLGIYLGFVPGVARKLTAMIRTMADLSIKRLERGSTTRDLFYYLNDEDLPDTPPPPPQQLADDGLLAVVAGSDTTAAALNNLFYCLLTNRATYVALQAEVDQVFRPEDDPYNAHRYQDMHYLRAVIYEVLRLYHPAAIGGQRQVPRNGHGVTAGSLYIPPGTIFFMALHALHVDPRYFTYPKEFWPERWLIHWGHFRVEDARMPAGKPQVHGDSFVHNDAAFIPFGNGINYCVGKGLAMMEMRMVVTALIHKFEIRLREGWNARQFPTQLKEYITSTRPELPVLLTPRW